MSQVTLRNSLHGHIESAAEALLQERDWHEQQIARIESILEQMKALAEGKPFEMPKGAKKSSRAVEDSAEAA